MMPTPASIAETFRGRRGEYDKAIADYNQASGDQPESFRRLPSIGGLQWIVEEGE